MDRELVFACRFCSFITSTVNRYITHQKAHRHVTKSFQCGVGGCLLCFGSSASLRSHLIRSHNIRVSLQKVTLRVSAANSEAKFVCSLEICKKEFSLQKHLISHIKWHIKQGIVVQCPFRDCAREFKSVNPFSGHISRDHRSHTLYSDVNLSNHDEPYNLECTQPSSEDEEECDSDAVDEKAALVALAQFYLKLECKYFVPDSTIQFVAEELEFLFTETHHSAINSLGRSLRSMEIPSDQCKQIVDSFAESSGLSRHFQALKSIYKRKEFFKKNFLYVTPQKVPLSNQKNFYYVSIKETLKAMMKAGCIKVNKEVCTSNENNVSRDFTDGDVFKENSFFKKNPDAIPIILYQDAFELVCPIGPARRRYYKILAVYMALGNLPSNRRFSKDNIQLVALCREKQFSHAKVYGKIVEELNELQTEGISTVDHKNVKAGLVFITGDNLGSHQLGGLNENFSKSLHFCRYCLIDRDSFKLDGGECRKFPARTVNHYNECLRKVKKKGSGKSVGHCGVKFDSIFNNVVGFHVCAPGLPPCLAHDMNEGVVAYDLMLLIKHFIAQGWFTLAELNALIEEFTYSSEDNRDKPVPLTSDGKRVVGSAWQVWTLLKLFPLIIKNFIKDDNDPVWECLLELVEIMEIVLAPEIARSDLFPFQSLIYDYLIKRKILFPNSSLKPKHHYLTHYPEMILNFGPLIKVWTLRFESKHTFFKRAWKSSHNNKNILLTLSNKHELFQAYVRLGANMQSDLNMADKKPFLSMVYCTEINRVLKEVTSISALQFEYSSVSIKGTIYRQGSVVVLKQVGFNEIEVGHIVLITVDSDQNVFFIVNKQRAVKHRNVCCYKLGSSENFLCVQPNQLLCFYPLHVYVRDTGKYIRLKHALLNGKM